jgi:hypothetical protein
MLRKWKDIELSLEDKLIIYRGALTLLEGNMSEFICHALKDSMLDAATRGQLNSIDLRETYYGLSGTYKNGDMFTLCNEAIKHCPVGKRIEDNGVWWGILSADMDKRRFVLRSMIEEVESKKFEARIKCEDCGSHHNTVAPLKQYKFFGLIKKKSVMVCLACMLKRTLNK